MGHEIIILFMDPVTEFFESFSSEMAKRPFKKQRRGSYKKNAGALVKVPRAIQTRGTPDGYYEIPSRQLFRLYTTSSSGFWNTNQTTNAAIGGTGYSGLAYYTQFDNAYVNLGNGGISAAVSQTVADSSSSGALFDLCKIAEIELEVWVTNYAHETSGTVGKYGAIELYFCQDTNDAVPPNALSDVIDRSKVLRVTPDGRRYKMKFNPYITTDSSSNDGAASTSTLSVAQPATYFRCARPAVSHFGFKAWVVTPSDATVQLYSVNMLVTQKRRFKMNQ